YFFEISGPAKAKRSTKPHEAVLLVWCDFVDRSFPRERKPETKLRNYLIFQPISPVLSYDYDSLSDRMTLLV
ncbi:MAG TPA: hypothetical protein VK475_01555, partial [Pyrinomonadaceae bacterium]|nr:hypothetical protein [Pyrinomonadaceae bacterium]